MLLIYAHNSLSGKFNVTCVVFIKLLFCSDCNVCNVHAVCYFFWLYCYRVILIILHLVLTGAKTVINNA